MKASYDIPGSALRYGHLPGHEKTRADRRRQRSNWYISGAPDPRWSDDTLNELKTIPGSAFEAVLTVDAQGNPIKPSSVLPQARISGRATGPKRRPGLGCRWTYSGRQAREEIRFNLQGRKVVKNKYHICDLRHGGAVSHKLLSVCRNNADSMFFTTQKENVS